MTDTKDFAAQVGPTLDSLAAHLKVPAHFVWDVMIRQVYVEFAVAVTVLALLIVADFFMVRIARKYWDDFDLEGPVVIGSGLFAVATLISLISVLVTGVAALNPQYAVLHELLGAIK